MDQPEINSLVKAAIDQLIEDQPELLSNDVSERALAHHLANYIAQVFPNYHVDVEYNRRGINVKLLNLIPRRADDDELKAITAFPDIIIHRRGVDTDNLLVLEIKKRKHTAKEFQYDVEKLRAFRDQLKYEHVAHVILGHDYRLVEWILD